MELNEAAGRILRGHWKLITALAIVCTMAALLLHRSDVPKYSATTRFVLDTSDPTGQTEASVIADTARAIATSPQLVAATLREIGVRRDPISVAAHEVTVTTLGSSGVLQLTATDQNPVVAASLANALSKAVIATRQEISNGRTNQILSSLDSQVRALTRQIDGYGAKIGAIAGQIATTSRPGALAALRDRHDNLVQLRDGLVQRRTLLQGEQANIAANQALRPQSSLIEPATRPAHPDPGRRLRIAALGAMLGLFLGVAVAALIEAFRPTIGSRASLVREIEAPVLGELPAPPTELTGTDVIQLAAQLVFASSSAGIDDIRLVSGAGEIGLGNLARLLSESLLARRESLLARRESLLARRSRPLFTVDVVSPSVPPSRSSRQRTGLVLVVPMTLLRSALQSIEDFVGISGWPLLGVIRYRPKRRTHLIRALNGDSVVSASPNGSVRESEHLHKEFSDAEPPVPTEDARPEAEAVEAGE